MFPHEAVELLLAWYDQNARDLPWRHYKDPYAVWVSEIMLQQTRAETVKPYFAKFMQQLPSIEALAQAEEEVLMKLWEGLGYYSRAGNLQKAAQVIVAEHGGRMPRDYRLLLSLPGIGRYTAGAIASIAFDIPVPAVDGNVLRVVARLTGDRSDVLLDATKKQIEGYIAPHVPTPRAGDFNQSLIELGALVCLPGKEAKCEQCPLQLICTAHREGTVDRLPVRVPKVKRTSRQLTVLLLQVDAPTQEGGDESKEKPYLIRKRPQGGLLGGLYEFPHLSGHLTPQEVQAELEAQGWQVSDVTYLTDAKHIFTHMDWYMIGYRCRVTPTACTRWEDCIMATPAEIKQTYSIPSAFRAYQKCLEV